MKPGLISIRWAALLAAALLAACSSTDKPQPKPLEPLTPKIAGRLVWSGKVDGVAFPLAVAVTPGVFTVAGNDGSVIALQADTGRELWRAHAGAPSKERRVPTRRAPPYQIPLSRVPVKKTHIQCR